MKNEEKRAKEERALEQWLFQLFLFSQQPPHPLAPHVPMPWYSNQPTTLYQSHDAYHHTETNDDQ